ncbi:UvrD-helicase domain-containing protein [Chlamydia avium]|uniref:RecBCD enzyme subunit RecB n=1 Tax=Chlamydia avium TaxID=1457141 RepID=A0ABN0MTL9_9CHLA|nr:UvrD-helicase domain-containing protein [Chlamydia avium]EPP36232.1 exodeoxyribonuclease V, beta subunit [Chlamydia psittaci 10_743_SC13]EPP38789.1 exodeoxyribonuclease V, beta subunit [Chlamydia avium]
MQPFDIFNPQTSIKGKYFLEASAGTGKTFTIEQIILRAILEGSVSHAEQILAVTFTNAATNELKIRIHNNLKQALGQLKSSLTNAVDSLPPYLPKDANVKQLYMKVRNALSTLDRMGIFTIHGFCNYILQQHCPADHFIQNHASLTHSQTILHYIKQYLSQDLWEKVLFPEQWYLLLARYPTHTRYSTSLIEKLLASYATDVFESLPDLSTTLSCLQEWHPSIYKKVITIPKEEFLDQLLNLQHSYRKQSFSISKDLQQFVDDLYNPEPSVKLFSFSRVAETFHPKNRLARYQSCLAFNLIEETPWLQYTEQFCNLDLIFYTVLSDLQVYLKTEYTPWISPDESISAVENLIKSESSEGLLLSLRERFQLVLIDEFQDTDSKQWNIFSKLFATKDFSGSLFLIGDPKQSIYEWRNADLPTYLKAKSTFPVDDQLHLLNNYRSSPKLMQGINFLFNKCSPFLEISGYSPIEYYPLSPQSTDDFCSDLHSPIHFFPYNTVQDQANWITNTARYLQQTYNIPLGHMVILVTDSSQAFDLITHSSIPLAFSKNKSIFHLTETAFLTLILLEAILYPEQYEKIQRVLLSSLFRLNLNDVIENKEHYSAYFFALHSYIFSHGLLATFYHCMTLQGEALLQTPQGDLIFQEMEKLCAYLESKSPYPHHQLLYLHYFAETGLWEENLSFSSYSEDEEVMKMTTIHASKGLEYDVVFCPGLDKSKKNKSSSEWIREMYVACTRAKKQLFIPIQNTQSSRQNSAWTNYVRRIGYSSIFEFAQYLAQQHPDLFSLSSYSPSSHMTSLSLVPPDTFTLTPSSSEPMFSFSSIKSMLDETSSHEMNISLSEITESSLPVGKKTGILIHKILETISPKFHTPYERILEIVTRIVNNTHLESYEQLITQQLYYTFSSPLTFSEDTFSLKNISPHKIRSEEAFLFSHQEELWQGTMDLFFEHNSRYYVIDWKTSFLGENSQDYSKENLWNYIKKERLDYQGKIYIYAAQRFLQQFDISKNVEMGFVFIRGMHYPNKGFFCLSPHDINPTIIQKYPAYH